MRFPNRTLCVHQFSSSPTPVSAVSNRTISVNLAVLHSVAQTVSLRLIGHKLTVCATARQRFKRVIPISPGPVGAVS